MIKRETKELGTETRPREGVMKEEKFPTPGNALTSGSMGSFGISEGNITGKGKKKHRIHALTTTPSGEEAQMLVTASSKQGLNREVRAALLRVRTGSECLEGNLRELT